MYTRDAKDRVTEIKEYINGAHRATTTYTYGDGHLVWDANTSTCEFDNGDDTVTANEMYWNWIPACASQPSDPNRLVSEERSNPATADPDPWAYKKEYRYDPAGNRLSMRESKWDSETRTWEATKVTRYNYMYDPDDPGTGNPRVVPNY